MGRCTPSTSAMGSRTLTADLSRPNTSSRRWSGESRWTPMASSSPRLVAGMEAVDANTLTLTLTEPLGFTLNALGYASTRLLLSCRRSTPLFPRARSRRVRSGQARGSSWNGGPGTRSTTCVTTTTCPAMSPPVATAVESTCSWTRTSAHHPRLGRQKWPRLRPARSISWTGRPRIPSLGPRPTLTW